MLVDLWMPRLDGARVVERIRREFSDAVLVVLTTYNTDDDIDQRDQHDARVLRVADRRAVANQAGRTDHGESPCQAFGHHHDDEGAHDG
jgi:CheY-like chemotaxis protein